MSTQNSGGGQLARTDNQAPAVSNETHAQNVQTLRTLADAAGLVQRYAAKLVTNERAGEFATQVSIMAQKNPKIRDCDPNSVVSAMMACVQLDLMPNTPEQHAHLIPYGRDLQFQLGYQGILEMVARSGSIEDLNAELVFEGDEFEYSLGINRNLVHKPNLDIDRTDYSKVVAAYTTIELENGKIKFDVMSRAEIDKVQGSAKAKSTDAPWHTWPEQMAKKTSIKRALKYMPKSKEDKRLSKAMLYDSLAEAGKLRFDQSGEVIIDGEVGGESVDDRKARMAAAEAKHKQLSAGGFKPKAITTES